MSDARVVLVVGPTACGKSAAAMELAALTESEIICADSMQVYTGLDIGTAKPSLADRASVPHHCLDIADPYSSGFSVEEWRKQAAAAIEEINHRGHLAIVVGGTNLYVRALTEGLFAAPAANPELRAELGELSQSALRERLAHLDPVAMERIHANDVRRTVRAIEVAETTGMTLSSQQTQWSSAGLELPQGWRVLGIECPSPTNASRSNARVHAMITAGFVAEVTTLLSRGSLGRQAADAIGYRELTEHLAGLTSLEDAVEAIKIRTRRLAKQQRTWLKRFRLARDSQWFQAETEPAAVARAYLRNPQS